MIVIIAVKEMSYDKKYSSVLDYMKLLEDFVLPLVKEDLGDKEVAELKRLWKSESKPIPDGASIEEKYEIAYGNWTRNWASAFNFVGKRLSEKGTEKFKHAAVEGLKRKNASPALYMLKIMRALSPQTAFKTFAKQMAFQIQVFSPLAVSELTGRRMVVDVSHCKVLDVDGCEDVCLVGCKEIYPIWMKDQFKVNYEPNRKGKSCTITLTPT